MSSLHQYWFFSVFISILRAEYAAYVTSYGNVNNNCNITNPCGSLSIVLRNIDQQFIINQHITIYVSGHYESIFDPVIDCYSKIKGNVTIIFNINHIKSTNDWIPYLNECVIYNDRNTLYQIYNDQYDQSNIEFYNLIYQNTHLLFIYSSADAISSIYCNNCTFSNINITPNHSINDYNFIHINYNAVFINCLFQNITSNSIYSSSFLDVSGLYVLILFYLFFYSFWCCTHFYFVFVCIQSPMKIP